ncbi:hypothetical protein J4H92_01735 [Leucobacter weissii]|uniref:Glutaminase n=1 Tax=Leucobacter weissii TaxID=1983706 RepID=A0A939MLJ7_9MICO|nr:hypothetical protein [Leucobacter weissii]MBO1900666.1 hypothetical protein [Leucobacter weissii]
MDEVEARAGRACAEARSRLRDAGIPPEALADWVPEGRRLLVLRRPAVLRPLGEVWRLGVLLLGTERGLYAVGRITRAAERGRAGYQSVSQEERREIAGAALRGGYAAGTAVNFDAMPLDLASPPPPEAVSPLGRSGGELRVRWRAGAPLESAPTLESYLAERVQLLTRPVS